MMSTAPELSALFLAIWVHSDRDLNPLRAEVAAKLACETNSG